MFAKFIEMRQNAMIKNIPSQVFGYFTLYSILGFTLEIPLLFIEQIIYGNSFNQWTSIQICIHLILISLIWGNIIFILLSIANSKYKFNIFTFNDKLPINRWIMVISIAFISVTITTILSDGFKPIKELINTNIAIFIFQNLYYLFESALILITLIFGQRYGELKFRKKNIIYGGLFLGATWGLFHIVTQNFAVGLYTFFMSLIYGLIYTLLNKNTIYTYLIITTIFIL